MEKKRRSPDSGYKRPVQSVQQNLPVQDFYRGTVITKDGRCVKILEVLPVPFFLKKVPERNAVSSAFMQLLKAAPGELHFKSVALPANLSHQIGKAEEAIRTEKNENCRAIGREYLERLGHAEKTGVMRRFFVSFCENIGKAGPDEAVSRIEIESARLRASLYACGNAAGDAEPAELLYLLLNRGKIQNKPFSERLREMQERYAEHSGGTSVPVPAGDLIAPERLSFRDPDYVKADDTYFRFLYIPADGYNSEVVTGWLDEFVNSYVGVDADVFLKRIPKESVINDIRRNIGHSAVNASDSRTNSSGWESASALLKSGWYLRNGLMNDQDFYEMGVILTVSGTDPDEISRKCSELKKTARKYDITLREGRFLSERMFRSVLPLCAPDSKVFSLIKRNALTEGAASVYPFTTFQMIHEEGTYIADDLSTGSPVILDPFNRDAFNNPHIFICGETGAGKSVTVNLLALRSRIRHIPVFILAPEKEDEFRRLCDAVGGQFVSLGAGSSARINIMEIFPKDRRGRETRRLIGGSGAEGSYLSEKISTLMEFFRLFISDMSLEEKQMLDEAIVRTYERFGITNDNGSLWETDERKGYRAMPVLDDLVRTLDEMKVTRLSRITRLLTSGGGRHFNGQTNIDVNNDFFVIGLEHNSPDYLNLSVYAAMDYCWSKIREDRTRNKLFIIDEWWKMAYDPIAANTSLEIAKTARAYGCSMIIATQQMSDILGVENGKYGNAVLNNCAIRILMSMKEKDLESVREMAGLTEAECRRIRNFRQGQGLLIAQDSRMSLQFNPSDTERLLTFTDRDTILAYREMKKEQEYQAERAELIENAEGMDRMFARPEIHTERLFSSQSTADRLLGKVLYTSDEMTDGKEGCA